MPTLPVLSLALVLPDFIFSGVICYYTNGSRRKRIAGCSYALAMRFHFHESLV